MRAVIKVLMAVLLLIVALFVVTVPLDLKSQWIFGMATIVASMVTTRMKSRRATVVLCVLSLLASTRYIFWRTTQTLEFGSFLEFILGSGLYLAELYAWIILALGFVQTVWPMHRPPMPLLGPDHELPTVDVYIPTYNESLAIVQNTVLAAMEMDYPSDRFRVYILDDGRRPDFRAFARQVGCGYLTRDNNLHAKAGNLNAAMKRTKGELICVFDCDHVPTRAFLNMTIGWFQREARLAVLQTPHYFYSPDPVQRNLTEVEDLPGEGELFYGTVQSGNDLWNAAFFCGSCAVIRRSALDDVNGFAGETVTEDAHTALKLQRRGWSTAYLNVRLSAGLATERLALHVGQRIRWARGMTQILRIDNPMLGRGLSFPQRICYLNAMLHFQFPLPRIVFLTSPLAYLLLGQNIIHASAQLIFAYALPHLVNSTQTSLRLQGRERRIFWGEIYETLLAFHLVKPTLWTFFSPHKGKFNVTDKGALLNRDFFDVHILKPHLITAGLLILGLIAGYARLLWPDVFHAQISTLLLNTGWVMFSLLILIASISVGRESHQIRNDVRIDMALPVTAYFEDGHVLDTVTTNVSMGGLAIELPKGFDVNRRQVSDICLMPENSRVTLPVETIRIVEGDARVRFRQLTLEQQALLVGVLMGRADAWEALRDTSRSRGPLDSAVDLMKVSIATITNRNLHASLLGRGVDATEAGAPDNGPGKGKPAKNRKEKAPVGKLAACGLWMMIGAGLLAGLANVGGAHARPAVAQTAAAAKPAAAVPATAQANAEAQPASSDGARRLRLTLKDMGINGGIRLAGVRGEVGIPFALRRDEVVTGATLTLNYAYSPSMLPDLSHLVVLVNDEVVRTIPLPRGTANGVRFTFPVDPAYFVPGDNRLNLRLVGHYTRDCEDPLHSTLWANVSNKRSFIDLTVQRLPVRPDLAQLPAPFFDKNTVLPLSLPFVFAGQPTDGELEAAGSTASWFGSLASYRGFGFPPMFGNLPTGNAVVFVTSSHMIQELGLNISGPAVGVVKNPRDPYGLLLVVMGRDDRELKLAAATLATAASGLGGQMSSIDQAHIRTLGAYEAPRWLRADRPVSLGELVDPARLQGQGLPPGALSVSFQVAPDLFFWPNNGADLHLRYRYPVAEWLDGNASRLDLTMNGQYLTTLPLSGSNWWNRFIGRSEASARLAKEKTTLPGYVMFGQNQLSFLYDLVLANKKKCEGTLPTDVRVSIDPDSTIDISNAYHYARLPNLAYFASAGFPFTRIPDLGETAVIMTQNPGVAEIETFLALMGRFGDSTGAATTRVTVTRTINRSQLENKDILIIGPLAMAGNADLFSGAPIRLEGGRLRISQTSPLDRIFRYLSPESHDSPGDADDFLVSNDMFEGIAAFRSPFNGDHSVVALLASSTDMLPDLVYGLREQKLNKQVQGDLSILSGDQMTSFHIGPDYSVGWAPWWLRLGYWLSQRPLLLALSAVLIAVLVAGPLIILLRAQERKRLGKLAE